MRTVSLCLKTMVLCTGHKKYAGNFHNAAGEREPGESSVRCGRLGRFVCGWLHVCLFLSRKTQKAMVGFWWNFSGGQPLGHGGIGWPTGLIWTVLKTLHHRIEHGIVGYNVIGGAGSEFRQVQLSFSFLTHFQVVSYNEQPWHWTFTQWTRVHVTVSRLWFCNGHNIAFMREKSDIIRGYVRTFIIWSAQWVASIKRSNLVVRSNRLADYRIRRKWFKNRSKTWDHYENEVISFKKKDWCIKKLSFRVYCWD